MRKTWIRILCVFLLLVMLMPVCPAVYAADKEADTEETYWPGVSFKSVAEFETYLDDCRRKNLFDEIGEYYSTIKSVYIPKAFRNHSAWIYSIAAEYYSYYEVHYKFEDTTYWFGTYYNTKAGEIQYGYSKELFDKKDKYPEYKPKKSEINGYLVYSYYVLGETYYNWQQDGVYHYLRVNKNPRDRDMCLKYCDAAALSLNIKATALKPFVTLKATAESYPTSTKSIQVSMTNNTSGEVSTGEYYTIEYYNKGTWEKISLDFEVPAIEIVIAPGQSHTFGIELYKEQYNYLPGKYRVVKMTYTKDGPYASKAEFAL